MSVDFEKYTGTVGANTNVNIVKSNARSSGKSNDIGKSGDVTLNKVGIRNVSKKTNIPTDADIDSETDPIASPSSSPSLTACKNAKKASDGINGLNPKKMDLKNLITLFMSMVCESEEERAKTLQQVSNQMGIANLNLALSKRETDRYAAEKQYSSSRAEAWGTIVKSSIQLVATCVSIGMMKSNNNKLKNVDGIKEKKLMQKQSQQQMDLVRGLGDAIGGIFEGGFKLKAAGDKYKADIAKADKEHIDATMNLINNLWSNFRQDFSAALNKVDKTASILKEAIDALLQTNMQISRNI